MRTLAWVLSKGSSANISTLSPSEDLPSPAAPLSSWHRWPSPHRWPSMGPPPPPPYTLWAPHCPHQLGLITHPSLRCSTQPSHCHWTDLCMRHAYPPALP